MLLSWLQILISIMATKSLQEAILQQIKDIPVGLHWKVTLLVPHESIPKVEQVPDPQKYVDSLNMVGAELF